MKIKLLYCLSGILFSVCLSACGVKGPLYHPKPESVEETPQNNKQTVAKDNTTHE